MTLAVSLISGGLDSITLAHQLKSEGYDLFLLAVDYGQRHKKELEFARRCAQCLSARFETIDLSGVGRLLRGSSLTDDIEVPEGHYAAANMAVTVVANRNAIMLAIAYGVAVAEQADVVAAGFHTGDHAIYPDCRPEFVRTFDAMERVATEGYARPTLRLYAPFVRVDKSDIVRIGTRLGVPFEDTWSCYKGLERHCGRCGTCVERKEAFALAGVPDPTLYLP